MKKISLRSALLMSLALVLLSACSGGGGGGVTVTQPTTAILTLASSVTGSIPADTIIAGYQVTIDLPAGVSVKSSNPPQVDADVVTLSSAAAGAGVMASYTQSTGSLPGQLKIILASTQSTGFTAGELGKVNCDIAAGFYPVVSDFTQPSFVVSGLKTDPTGSVISTVDLTGQMSLAVTAEIK